MLVQQAVRRDGLKLAFPHSPPADVGNTRQGRSIACIHSLALVLHSWQSINSGRQSVMAEHQEVGAVSQCRPQGSCCSSPQPTESAPLILATGISKRAVAVASMRYSMSRSKGKSECNTGSIIWAIHEQAGRGIPTRYPRIGRFDRAYVQR